MDFFGLPGLKLEMYLDYCKRHEVLPNSAVLSWFCKAKIQKSRDEKCSIVVFLDQLKDDDFYPLIDVFLEIASSDIDAVDILQVSPCALNEEYIMPLMRAVSIKLRVVDLQDMSFKKDCLQDLSQVGLSCQVLNLMSPHIQKLNMVGRFLRLHTLNLDFCTSLNSLQKDCFSCMPNLMCLSMCETRVANLWTTTAALSKLPSLVELRFQNCLCCKDTGPCPTSSYKEVNILACDRNDSSQLNRYSYSNAPSIDRGDVTFHASGTDEAVRKLYSLDYSFMKNDIRSATDVSSDNTEVKLSSDLRKLGLSELSSSVLPVFNGQAKFQNEVSFSEFWIREENESFVSELNWDSTNASITLKKYISHHPSPICFEKHYREYIIASLPCLKVLDNLPIREMDRDMAKSIFSKYYEYLPYKRRHKESVVSVLQNRELGLGGIRCQKSPQLKQPYPYGKSQYFFSRSLSAAKLGSSTWPLLHPVLNFDYISTDENKRLRPRQFEYHPSNSSLMAFGTLDGEVVVINHENGNIVGYIPSIGAMNSVLGLCWLKKYPFKVPVITLQHFVKRNKLVFCHPYLILYCARSNSGIMLS
ncbi:hypothetical protein L1049_023724 [Liquidambar formosana]|uniref:U2A'/phosphoprotein 32 family A C-terminal domain-containing protein n=1 Tax=Liquidambar formosana TaxID=63359 RepID=A0AAP0RUY5_LIQFO